MQQVRSANRSRLAKTPPASRTAGWDLQEIAHDARSLTTALGLYCDLLAQPGVLAEGHLHYVDELRLVSAATRRLMEKLGSVMRGADSLDDRHSETLGPILRAARRTRGGVEPPATLPIQNLAEELQAIRALLEAVAGTGVSVELRIEGAQVAVQLTSEDLIRILVNLVRNAAEAMRSGGAIAITLSEREEPNLPVVLVVEDNGPGVPQNLCDKIFAHGFTTSPPDDDSMRGHRGLGLSIARSVVEGAGGRISARNRADGGAHFEIELPVRRP